MVMRAAEGDKRFVRGTNLTNKGFYKGDLSLRILSFTLRDASLTETLDYLHNKHPGDLLQDERNN